MRQSSKPDHDEARPAGHCVLTSANSKADTLALFAGRLRAARVPTSAIIEWRHWQADRIAACARVQAALGAVSLAVRSSRRGEDAPGAGNAGRYCSLIGIPPARLQSAITSVFASYGRPEARDQVLIQPCIAPVSQALVAANRAPGDGALYDAISRAEGPSSSAITAGTVAAETRYLAHGTTTRMDAQTTRVQGLLREVESLIGDLPFELELVRSGRTLWLLQLRLLPPVAGVCAQRASKARARAGRARLRAQARNADRPALLGLMPDWNPAELLGEHPRPLALDLFRLLISRDTWWQARVALGYGRPRERDLIVAIAGRPYVDVRASFDSLLPAALDSGVARRVTSAWSAALCKQPALHDRVETAVALTCAEFDADARMCEHGIRRSDRLRMLNALNPLTQSLLNPAEIKARAETLEALARQHWDSPIAPAAALQALRRLRLAVALPFAQAARIDFVIAALLNSAARMGVIEWHQVTALRGTARTAAGELVDALAAGDRAALQERQQALRPGTFEIAIPTLSSWSIRRSVVPAALLASEDASLTAAQRAGLARLLQAQAPYLDAATLIALAPMAARAREVGKLALSRGISTILSGLTAWGTRWGLDRELLGWLDIKTMIEAADAPSRLLKIAASAALRHAEDAGLRMPAVLAEDDDLAAVRCTANAPSFIGNAPVSGPVCVVNRTTAPHSLPRGAIAAIESADPGFDWIFTRSPVALVTAFGGPHSHMALRCSELGLAAALGLGLSRFRRFAEASHAQVDPLRAALNITEPTS